MNKPREYMGYLAYLSQEILLDAATPGKVAAERLVTNARTLHDTVQSWAEYCNWSLQDLLKEVWKHDKEAEHAYRERTKKATGRKRR